MYHLNVELFVVKKLLLYEMKQKADTMITVKKNGKEKISALFEELLEIIAIYFLRHIYYN